jgi:FtsP/CotA-like multicopper oxidase with cupredoxin domain
MVDLRDAILVLLGALTLTHAVSHAIDYATVGEPLLKIPEDSSHNVTLNMDAVKYVGPYASFTTRGYPSPGNLGIPGPTIRITPGKHLTLTLNNKLGSNGNAPSTMNEFRDPNTTNIHTHGLHVSSAVDDVFVEVRRLSRRVGVLLILIHAGATRQIAHISLRDSQVSYAWHPLVRDLNALLPPD